jgi:hypothetical protein
MLECGTLQVTSTYAPLGLSVRPGACRRPSLKGQSEGSHLVELPGAATLRPAQ